MFRSLLFCPALIFCFAFSLQAQKPTAPQNPSTPQSPPAQQNPAPKAKPVVTQDSLYRWRIKQERLDGIYIPSDLGDCFVQLDKAFDADAKKTFLAIPEKDVDSLTHNTIGRWMDVRWHISEGSRLTAKFSTMGVPHYDYMISMILITYHRSRNGKDPKAKELMEVYRADWNQKQEQKRKERMQKAAAKEKGK